jgi:hypothetical protein
MHQILAAFVKKSWLRWLAATCILAIGIIAIMTPDERAMVAMKAMSYIGGQR